MSDTKLFYGELKQTLRERYRATLSDRRRAIGVTGMAWGVGTAVVWPLSRWKYPWIKASFGPALSIGVGMGITVGAMREAALYTTGDIVSPTYYFLSSLAGTTGWVAFGLRLAPKDAMLTSAVLSALSTVVTLMVESKAEAQKVRAFENHYEIGGKEGTVRGQDQKLYDLWLRARDEQGRLSVEGKGGGLFWGAPPSIDDFRNPAGQVDYTAFYRELEKHYIRPFQWDVVETYKNSTTPSDFNPNKYLKTMDSTVDKYRKRDD